MGNNLEDNTERIIEEFGCVPDCVSILEPTNDIVSLYKHHKVFLNASRSEGGSYAILEAYYSGCLCVLSNVPATKESNLPGVVYFKSEDSEDLYHSLIYAYEKRNEYKNDIDYVLKNFSIDQWSDTIIKIMGLKG